MSVYRILQALSLIKDTPSQNVVSVRAVISGIRLWHHRPQANLIWAPRRLNNPQSCGREVNLSYNVALFNISREDSE